MLYNRINPGIIIVLALLIVGVVYFYGSTASDDCISIGQCRACYVGRYVRVDDSLCGNVSEGYVCVRDPAVDRRNAMVDVLECACSTYSDEYRAEREKLHKLLLYSTSNASDIAVCDFEQFPVVRWKESYIAIPEERLRAGREAGR